MVHVHDTTHGDIVVMDDVEVAGVDNCDTSANAGYGEVGCTFDFGDAAHFCEAQVFAVYAAAFVCCGVVEHDAVCIGERHTDGVGLMDVANGLCTAVVEIIQWHGF